ncbi:TPA: hypothetical protein N0F65_012179 [Lagenidium giganteum]|uniref:Uncharacterized protein n=1 Tax=Lagenidium giganteum TaxID=4803 RepID=A0AAV2ZEE6_9STRA|nr:TPA: hypothetical protein N0F65_012179 [Lagenidium giganteum]
MTDTEDAVTTTIPYLNMFAGLRTLKTLLQLHSNESSTNLTHMIQLSTASVNRASTASVQPEADEATPPPPPSQDVVVAQSSLMTRVLYSGPRRPALRADSHMIVMTRAGSNFIHALMPLCGVVVLLISIVSSGIFPTHQVCGHGCKLQVMPWFSTRCACAVQEINCYRRGISGNATEIGQVMQSLDETVLRSLIFSHCSSLTIPREFRNFGVLMGMEIYNSTLVDWPAEASPLESTNSQLTYMYFVRSTLDRIPDGMLNNISSKIIDIEIIACSLGPLPSDLASKWSSVTMLYLEHCNIQEFPPVVAELGLTDFSLVGNNITSLPLVVDTWLYLYLDGNADLASLPDANSTSIVYMSIEDTQIATLPSWTTANIVCAFNTPVCANSSETWPGTVWCEVNEFVEFGVFPLSIRDRMRVP